MKIYFSHGKESGPWGTKIKRLAAVAKKHNYSVDSIDYSHIPDPDQRVEYLKNRLMKETEDFILVGSSMGGYVSLVVSEHVNTNGIFLLAPALYMPEYKIQNYHSKTYIEIIHGWQDDVIPPENSIKFAKNTDCTLHLISGDHRLNTSLDTIEMLFSQFLSHL